MRLDHLLSKELFLLPTVVGVVVDVAECATAADIFVENPGGCTPRALMQLVWLWLVCGRMKPTLGV